MHEFPPGDEPRTYAELLEAIDRADKGSRETAFMTPENAAWCDHLRELQRLQLRWLDRGSGLAP